MAVALPVCWYIQMVSPKWLMALAKTETICPSQTRVKPFRPERRVDGALRKVFMKNLLRWFGNHPKKNHPPVHPNSIAGIWVRLRRRDNAS
jgi:hypothetical protein